MWEYIGMCCMSMRKCIVSVYRCSQNEVCPSARFINYALTTMVHVPRVTVVHKSTSHNEVCLAEGFINYALTAIYSTYNVQKMVMVHFPRVSVVHTH